MARGRLWPVMKDNILLHPLHCVLCQMYIRCISKKVALHPPTRIRVASRKVFIGICKSLPCQKTQALTLTQAFLKGMYASRGFLEYF